MSATVSLPALPDTANFVQRMLATMAALSGVVTDYNSGSQVRTMAEAIGSVIDMEGVAVSALALKALAYGTASAYGITSYPAQQATGSVTFATSFTAGAPLASQAVAIPVNTIVSTAGGVQYFTSAVATLAIGATGVACPVTALISGPGGNAPANAVNQLLSNLGYPLFVNNGAPIINGAAAEAPAVTLARLAAVQEALGLSSPVAVANACIGVVGSDNSICQFSNCFEPWVGTASGTAGFTVYIDNGSGAASASLITAVAAKLQGNASAGRSGYRPAGVPYSVAGVTPIFATVTVSGTLLPVSPTAQVQASVTKQVQNYFNQLSFNASAMQPQVAAAASDAALGYFSSLSVFLYAASGGAAVPLIAAAPNNRIILTTLNVTLS